MTTQQQAEYFDKSACQGYPRCASTQEQAGFGADTGLDHRPTTSGQQCQCSAASPNAYTDAAPMAQYVPGQRVCLAYPAKNHVAETCTNQYIPDAGMVVRRSPTNVQTDAEFSTSYNHLNGAHENGVIDYQGFQNCPKFCENMDRSLCTMCFDLEATLTPGRYSFQWLWSFNTLDDQYATCWEAEIVALNDAPLPSTMEPVDLTPTIVDTNVVPTAAVDTNVVPTPVATNVVPAAPVETNVATNVPAIPAVGANCRRVRK